MSGISPDLESIWTLQLYREFDETAHYYKVNLPRPHIQLTQSRTRYGSYDSLQQTLSISLALITENSWDVVLEVLKHEMAHMLAGDARSEETAHGAAFQKACQRLGVAPWARHAHIEIDPDAAIQQHRRLSLEQERVLRRVEKLLSLASSSQPHEASLAMERARELCAKHQFDTHLGGEGLDYTYVLIQHEKKVIPAHQASICSILCTHFYVDCVTRFQYDAREQARFKVLEILGTRENVQMAEYVYWFLWNQLPLLWQNYKREKSQALEKGKTGGRASPRSFYLGVLRGFHEKLSQQKQAAPMHATQEGLMLDANEQRKLEVKLEAHLRQFVRERFPHLHRGGSRRQGLHADDFAGGREKGKSLNLHRGLTTSHRGAIQLLHSGKG